jgi:hypothetical protein
VVNLKWVDVPRPHGVDDAVRRIGLPVNVDVVKDIPIARVDDLPASHAMGWALVPINRVAEPRRARRVNVK